MVLQQEIQTGNQQIISFQFPQQRVLILHLDHIRQLEVVMEVALILTMVQIMDMVVMEVQVVEQVVIVMVVLVEQVQEQQVRDTMEVVRQDNIILVEVEEQEKLAEVLLLQQEVHMVEKEKRLIF